MAYFVYVGTYTGPERADGIPVFRMDGEGTLTPVTTVTGVDSPSFLAVHPTEPLLLAVSEVADTGGQLGGSITSFRINESDGTLTQLSQQLTHGKASCHVSVHPSNRYALVANYSSGNLVVFPIQTDGTLKPASDIVQHEGQSSNSRRQNEPHAHSITPDAAGNFVLACDLGIDRILVYRLDTATGKLVPNTLPFAQVSSGAGPRHLAFHPNGAYVYVINEIDSTMSVFAYDAERGALQITQTVSTLPEGYSERTSCAQVVVHPTGQWVYGSNRGHDSLAMYAIDQSTGRLTSIGWQSTNGRTPRNFNIDPSGTFLLAANQASDNLVTFRIDQATGKLNAVSEAKTACPVCVVFRKA